MKTINFRTLLAVVATLALLVAAGNTAAEELHQHVRADGLDIYYGFLPAEVAGRVTSPHDDEPIHGRARRGDYHLMVALYDLAGERINEAAVHATVAELGLAGRRKTLDAMMVGDTMTFGNYFPMRNAGQYRVTLEIRLPGAARPVEARFEHRHR